MTNENAISRQTNTVKIMPLMRKGTMSIDAWTEKNGLSIHRSPSRNPMHAGPRPENGRKIALGPANDAIAILCRGTSIDLFKCAG